MGQRQERQTHGENQVGEVVRKKGEVQSRNGDRNSKMVKGWRREEEKKEEREREIKVETKSQG
jgi:hypothetical protein